MAFLSSILTYFPISAEIFKSIFLNHCNLASIPTLSTLSQSFLTPLKWKHRVSTLCQSLTTVATVGWSSFFLGGRTSLKTSQIPPSGSQLMALPSAWTFSLNPSPPSNTEHLELFSCLGTAAAQHWRSLAWVTCPRWRSRSGLCHTVIQCVQGQCGCHVLNFRVIPSGGRPLWLAQGCPRLALLAR